MTGNGADAVLALDDVHTYYGNIHALKGVTMEVGKGEIVSLIGSNGAGKSTTLRTISGIQRARQGSVTLNGKDITALAGHEIVKLGIAHSPEGRHVFTPHERAREPGAGRLHPQGRAARRRHGARLRPLPAPA